MTKFRIQVFSFMGVIMLVYMYLNIHSARVSMETGFISRQRSSHLEKTIRQLANIANDTLDTYEQNPSVFGYPLQNGGIRVENYGGEILKRLGQVFHPEVEMSTLPTTPSTLEDDIVDEEVTSVRGFGSDEGSCYFQDRLDKDGLPIIHSIFIDHVVNRIVMIGVQRENVTEPWERENFICDFSDNVVNYDYASEKRFNGHVRGRSRRFMNIQLMTISDPIINDFQKVGQTHQGVLVITCPVPDLLRNNTSLKLKILKQSDPKQRYSGLTICGNGPVNDQGRPNKLKLGMCTMMKNMNKFVPDWLKYHKKLGVQRVFIYDNAKISTLPYWVQGYIDNGFLTIIPWAHTISDGKTYLETQIASENDCIWRHKHDVEWMIKIDVDEFLQPMDPNRHLLTDYFGESAFLSLGSLKLQNWFFCPPPKYSSDYNMDVLRAKTIFGRNTYRAIEPTELNRGRDKTIVRPANVHYFKIHIVKWGAPSVSLSPVNEIRMVHYRGDNPLHRGFCPKKLVKDTSMLNLWRTFK